MTTESPRWFKSSYSDNGGNCVEVAANLVAPHGEVPVRDSKSADGAVITFGTAAFAAFVGAARNGSI